MSLLKQKIMESAKRFFAEKGYNSTSVQDIANDCEIAKGSIYKFFSSKEDLLMEVYGDRVRRMYEEADRLKADETFSPRDRFIRETRLQLEYWTEVKFSLEEYQELPTQEAGKFVCFCHGLRARQLNYNKDILLALYGPELTPRIWDFVMVYLGIMKELTQLPHSLNQPQHLEQAAEFVVERMDETAAGIRSSRLPLILEPSFMEEYVRTGLAGTAVPADKHKTILFDTLLSTVQELPVPQARKAELAEAAQLLREESEKEQPKRVLLRALLQFLQARHELKNIVNQLDTLLRQ